MKNLLFLFIIKVMTVCNVFGQLSFTRNLGADANFFPSNISIDEATTCGLIILNPEFTGTGPNSNRLKDTLYSGSLFITVAWGPQVNALTTVPGGTPGPGVNVWSSFFNWSHVDPNEVPGFPNGGWIGISNTNIVQQAGLIEFYTSGKAPGVNSIGANINVQFVSPWQDSNPNNNNPLPLVTVSTPAPVELSSFDAKSENCNSVELSWNTVSELNNAYFEVLRSSDGKEFLSLGRVEGSNASQGSRYTFTDATYLTSGNKYLYRLRQVDFDGKMTYHDVISHVHYCEGERSVFGVFPNPAFDRINTTFTGPFSDEVTMLLLNNDGSIIRRMQVAPVDGNLDISDLAAGVYQIKVMSQGEEYVARFIKID